MMSYLTLMILLIKSLINHKLQDILIAPSIISRCVKHLKKVRTIRKYIT